MRKGTLEGEERALGVPDATEKSRKIRSKNYPLDLVIWKSLMTLESSFLGGQKPDFSKLNRK